MHYIKRFVSKILIFIFALLLTTQYGFSGTVGKIAGKITDAENGDAIIGAAVMIVGTSMGAATDIDGEYFILNVPPGSVTLKVSALGYAGETLQEVQITSDQTTTLNFKLNTESLQGEEVVVMAERKLVEVDKTFSTATVASKEIAALPVTNLGQVIELQAGVVDGHFRGGRSGEVLYLVDGVSITDVYDNSQATTVDKNAVEELQVISGTFNAEYGQVLSGVVNLTTKDGGSEFHGSASSEFGDYVSSHDDVFLHIGSINPATIQDYNFSLDGPVPYIKNLNFFASGRYLDDGGWLTGQRRWGVTNEDLFTGDTSRSHNRGNNSFAEMNYNLERFGNLKLSYGLSASAKLIFSTLMSSRNYRDYDHSWKYVPDATQRRYRDGRTNLLKLNQVLNAAMFYEIALSNTFSEYHSYAFEDPQDTRYINPDLVAGVNGDGIILNVAGNDNSRFRRYTNSNQLVGNFSWQANKRHLFKAGIDIKLHTLFFEDINLLYPTQTSRPVIPDETTLGHDKYSTNPSEYALYVQDKLEFNSLIVNAGLRYDYFDPDGRYPSDPKDPSINDPKFLAHEQDPLSVRQTYWYKKATGKSQVSPRLGVAYPMSDKGFFHFAYGHFAQRPTFERLYQNPEYELNGSGLSTVMGNPDLKMEETVSYEFGFDQQIAEDIKFGTSIFFRDIRNLVASDKIVETYESGTKYSQFVNRSFGEVKGITLSMDKRYSNNFSAFTDYTYQIAEGDASDPQSAYNAQQGDHPREPNKQLVPLNWDRRHTINAGITYATMGNNNWGGSLIGKYGSGLPYTPDNQGIRTGFENDGRKPDFYNVDLSAFKSFSISAKTQQKLVITLTILNLLDTLNEDNIYTDTGRAGYSQFENNNRALERPEINTFKEVFTNPSFYSRPRMVKIGAKVEF